MVSFYGFYTSWSIILALLSISALAYIVYTENKTNSTSPTICDVDLYKLNYNLYELMVLVLSLTIFTSLINTITYFCTRNEDSSPARKFTIFILFVFYVLKFLGLIPMLIQFNDHRECFTFYKDISNNQIGELGSFVGIVLAYSIELLFVMIGFITMLCCSEKPTRTYYNNFK